MPNSYINQDNVLAFPAVRRNTRDSRSFTEQNTANLISNLFADFEYDTTKTTNGFVVRKDGSKILFNICGRFFNVDFGTDANSTLYVAIYLDNTKEIVGQDVQNKYQGLAYASSNSFDAAGENQNRYVLQLLQNGNPVNQIHLYVGDSDNDNAYQTKSQITEVYGKSTDTALISGNLYQKVKAILAIDTIDGGTIS